MQRDQPSDKKEISPILNASINNLSITQFELTFPPSDCTETLSPQDYQHFLTALASKRATFPTQNHAFKLTLKTQTGNENALLLGLHDYLKSPPSDANFPATQLVLDGKDLPYGFTNGAISLNEIVELFTRPGLPAVTLEDTSLTQNNNDHVETIKQFVTYIKDYLTRDIMIDLTLPNRFRQTEHQSTLDNLFEERRLSTLKTLAAREVIDLSRSAPKSIYRTGDKRTRPEVNLDSLAIDVEMQQEQQVEQASVEPDTHELPDEVYDDKQPEYLTKETFIKLVESGFTHTIFSLEDKLKIPYFPSNQAGMLWDTWVGGYQKQPLKKPGKKEDHISFQLSISACKELLMHWPQFQFGIDLLNLPVGFNLHKTPKGKQTEYSIDFNVQRKYTDKDHPLKVQCETATNIEPLSMQAFNIWLVNHDKDNETQRLLMLWWETINITNTYKREAFLVFRKYLPQLLSLPPSVIKQLRQVIQTQENKLNALEGGATFEPRLFEYLVKNYDAIAKNIDTANSKLQRLFGESLPESKHSKLLNYLDEVAKYQHRVTMNTLLELLRNNQPDKINQLQIESEITELKHNYLASNSDGLLQVYLTYGDNGILVIHQLLTRHPSAFGEKNPAVAFMFGNMQTLAPLITDKENYEFALAAIASFSHEKRAWFNTLLKQHCEAQQTHDLPRLVNAFMAFCATLDGYGADFTFPLQCHLTGIKDMPTALSRLEKLIATSRADSKLEVWRNVANFNGSELDSTGFVKAMREETISGKASKEWSFFIPEQKIELRGLDLTTGIYSTQESWKSLHTNPVDKDVRAKFFRYVAFQQDKCQLSLAFYQEADRLIQTCEMNAEVKSGLYALVADATTKSQKIDSSLIGLSPISELKSIISILKNREKIVGMQKNTLRLKMIESLMELKTVPPLSILRNIFTYVTNKTTDVNIVSLAANLASLKILFNKLNASTHLFESSVYSGLNDYSSEHFATGEVFSSFLDVTTLIQEQFAKDNGLGRSLVALIGKFSLERDLKQNEKILRKVCDDIKVIGLKNSRYLCEILSYMILKDPKTGVTKNKPLAIHDLKEMITAFGKNANQFKTKTQVFEWLAYYCETAQLKQYFPAGFFTKRQLNNESANPIDETDQDRLLHSFTRDQKNKIIDALLKFYSPADGDIYPVIIVYLAEIAAKLDSNERILFMENVIKLCEQRDSEIVDLSKLLITINTTNRGAEYFNSFMEHTNHISEEAAVIVDDICKKACLFITKMMPALDEFETHAKDQPQNQVESTPLKKTDLLAIASKLMLKQHEDNTEYVTYSAFVSDAEKAISANVHSIKGKNHEEIFELFHTVRDNLAIDSKEYLHKLERFLEASTISASLAKRDLAHSRLLQQQLNEMRNGSIAAANTDHVNALIAFTSILLNKKESEPYKTVLASYPDLLENEKYLLVLCTNKELQTEITNIDITKLLAQDINSQDVEQIQHYDLIAKALDKDLKNARQLLRLTQESAADCKTLLDYRYKLTDRNAVLFKKIAEVCNENPICKKSFLELFESYLAQLKDGHTTTLENAWYFVSTIQALFSNIPDKNDVLSLCVNFNTQNKDYKPADLLDLAVHINKSSNQEQVKQLSRIASSLVTAKKYEPREFKALCGTLINSLYGKQLSNILHTIYSQAPCPRPSELLSWLYVTDASKRTSKDNPNEDALAALDTHKQLIPLFEAIEKNLDSDEQNKASLDEINTTIDKTIGPYVKYINHKHHNFDLIPFQKDLKNNGFKYQTDGDNDAAKILKKFTASKDAILPTEKDLVDLDSHTKEYDALATKELRDRLTSLKANYHAVKDAAKLTALLAALLYRTTGNEFNTTQYLDLLVLIKNKRVVAGIATGQGKTRVVMAALAAQAFMGNTVDFVTDNFALATREYVEFLPFFKSLNYETSLVHADAPINSYKLKGINFSDRTQLNLFRNKAFSKRQHHHVLDQAKQHRALVADEVDSLLYDSSDTSYKYSTASDPALQNMQWVYHYLMMFMQKGMTIEDPYKHKLTTTNQLYKDDVDLCRESFITFVRSREMDKEKINRLLQLNAEKPDQIELWQKSAVTAWGLEVNKHFTIEKSSTPISTPDGLRHSSSAVVLVKDVKAYSSKFSLGVHQCLLARLNYHKANINGVMPKQLESALEAIYHPFYIPDEKQVVYSSTSKDLLDQYKEGSILGVTGTPGSAVERDEAAEMFQLNFVDAPPHQIQQGKETQFHFYKNKDEAAKFEGLIEQLTLAMHNNQPVLIICRDTNKSQEIAKKIKERLVAPNNAQLIQEVDCRESLESAAKKFKFSGEPRTITVATEIAGRGVDIKPSELAEKHGLNVMGYHLAATRDLTQFVGRTRRNGAMGESHIFFDASDTEGDDDMPASQDDLKKIAAYYQTRKDIRKQIQRLIKTTEGDFRKRFHELFFKPDQTGAFTPAVQTLWTRFEKEIEQAWNDTQCQIQFILNDAAIADTIDGNQEKVQRVNAALIAYQKLAYGLWGQFKQSAHDADKTFYLPLVRDEVTLSERAAKLIVHPLKKPVLAPKEIANNGAPLPPPNNHPRAHDDAAAQRPQVSRKERLKRWIKQHPILTGIIIGAIVGVLAAVVVVSCGAAIPAIGATAAAFGTMICAGFTSAAVTTSVAMAVGSCVAIAIGIVGSMITGAIIGAFAKLGIKPARDKQAAAAAAPDNEENAHNQAPRSRRLSSASLIATFTQENQGQITTHTASTENPSVSASNLAAEQPPAIKTPDISDSEINSLADALINHREALLQPVDDDGANDNNSVPSPAKQLLIQFGGIETELFKQLRHLMRNELKDGIVIFLKVSRDLVPSLKQIIENIPTRTLAFK